MRWSVPWAGLLLLAPLAAFAAEKPQAAPIGVGEISCSATIDPSLCAELTQTLVEVLDGSCDRPVLRRSKSGSKGTCEGEDCDRPSPRSFSKLVSGTVRPSGEGAEVRLRLLDGTKMAKEAEGHALAPSMEKEALAKAVREAAAPLAEKLK